MQSRNEKIDFIKMLAIVFVIGIHITASMLYEEPIASNNWIMVLLYRSIISPAVPLFFMCSGVLLFDKAKNISIDSIFKKYILRIIIALFFWAGIYELMHIVHRYMEVGVFEKTYILNAVKNIIYFNHNYQLYFIYIMVIFYLFTPIIKIFINNARYIDIKYFLILWFILGVLIPNLMIFDKEMKFINLTHFITIRGGYSFLFCGIMGYYVYNNPRNMKSYIFALIIGFLITFFGTYFLSALSNTINVSFLSGTAVGVILMAYGFFGFIISTDFKIYKLKVVNKISLASFCIFLSHDIFLKLLLYIKPEALQYSGLVNIVLLSTIILIGSYIIYFTLSKIKYVNKYLI